MLAHFQVRTLPNHLTFKSWIKIYPPLFFLFLFFFSFFFFFFFFFFFSFFCFLIDRTMSQSPQVLVFGLWILQDTLPLFLYHELMYHFFGGNKVYLIVFLSLKIKGFRNSSCLNILSFYSGLVHLKNIVCLYS